MLSFPEFSRQPNRGKEREREREREREKNLERKKGGRRKVGFLGEEGKRKRNPRNGIEGRKGLAEEGERGGAGKQNVTELKRIEGCLLTNLYYYKSLPQGNGGKMVVGSFQLEVGTCLLPSLI